ncbi:MAG: DUF1616 domain-containing protein [Candidatus Baldrarchaeia archaeon]
MKKRKMKRKKKVTPEDKLGGKKISDFIRSLNTPITLSELIDILTKKYAIKLEEAAKMIYVAWKNGELEMLEPKPPRNLLSYTFTLRSLWFWLLTTLIGITIAIVLYVSEPPLIYLRYVLGSVFVLYLPGATLIEALYPRGEDLEPLERLALSIGLSLAVVPLIGLVLNYTPWGIRLQPILTALALFTECMAIAALIRKYKYYKLRLEELKF